MRFNVRVGGLTAHKCVFNSVCWSHSVQLVTFLIHLKTLDPL
jgi:hypothetical protein